MRAFRSVEEGSKWKVSEPTANFLSGGLASNAFWLTAFPFDAVKKCAFLCAHQHVVALTSDCGSRMMADSITQPKYSTWMSSARSIATEGGARAFYRGFVPCLLRAFPTARLPLSTAAHKLTERTERIGAICVGVDDAPAQGGRTAEIEEHIEHFVVSTMHSMITIHRR